MGKRRLGTQSNFSCSVKYASIALFGGEAFCVVIVRHWLAARGADIAGTAAFGLMAAMETQGVTVSVRLSTLSMV